MSSRHRRRLRRVGDLNGHDEPNAVVASAASNQRAMPDEPASNPTRTRTAPSCEGAVQRRGSTLDYILYFVPGSRVIFPVFGPDMYAQIEAETGSSILMIFAAAPVPPVTLPVTVTRVVPAGTCPLSSGA